nr:hypothetical protein [Tanacetum cinerariifolium]
MCDVPSHDNSPPLDVSKDQIEDFSKSNKEFSSIDDDSFSIDNIDYVEASPPDYELISSEVMEIVIPEHQMLIPLYPPIARPSLPTSLNSLLEETNTFDNSLPEFETFCFDVEEISSGSPTTHFDSSFYASFIFDLSINPFPPADRSDFYEFSDELIPFISPPNYDCFLFKVKEYQKKDKLGLKPDKNRKRGEAEKSQKQLQWIKQEKLKKTQKEGQNYGLV